MLDSSGHVLKPFLRCRPSPDGNDATEGEEEQLYHDYAHDDDTLLFCLLLFNSCCSFGGIPVAKVAK